MDPTSLGQPRAQPPLPSPAVVCSLMFGAERWTPKAAQIWARMNGYHAESVRHRGQIVRVENHNPALFERGTFRTVTLASDVRAIVGTRKVRRRSTRSSPSRRTRARKR